MEQAHNGSLLLDEVGSLDIGVQSNLLQVLQDGSFMRVGGHDMRNIQTRLVSVANRDLRDQVGDGTFRLDFLYRINAVTSCRLGESAARTFHSWQHFMALHAAAFQVAGADLPQRVIRIMQKHEPGRAYPAAG